jgi:hypothetical protein
MMDDDKRLLEAAAKAVGINLAWSSMDGQSPRDSDTWQIWDPLTDDGDALRLAVKLRLQVFPFDLPDDARVNVAVCCDTRVANGASEAHDGDPYAATRRAITRAAAAMAKETA